MCSNYQGAHRDQFVSVVCYLANSILVIQGVKKLYGDSTPPDLLKLLT